MKLAENQKNFYYKMLYNAVASINSSIFTNIHNYVKRKELNISYNSLSSIESFLLNRLEEAINAKF